MRDFAGQRISGRALPVLRRALQQRAPARRIGHDADAIQVHEPEQVLGIGVACIAGGREQRVRLTELQRTQRCACRLQRVLGSNLFGGSAGRGYAYAGAETDGAAQCKDLREVPARAT